MKNSVILERYLRIYNHLYTDPFIRLYKMKNVGVSRSSVSQYLREMYELSIIKGPMILLKPAVNYKEYVGFLRFKNARSVHALFKEIPGVVYECLTCGYWNVMLVCNFKMDFSLLKGLQECVYQGVKGRTWLSKVTTLDWDHSLEKMYNILDRPKEKTCLYEEVPCIPWDKREWCIYYKLQPNLRVKIMPILTACHLRFEKYQKWFSQLGQYAVIKPAFYPCGVDNYFTFDFLFESVYHKQLVRILGMLPSTSVFYSVGDNLFARLFVLTKKEKDDLFGLIFTLEEKDYFEKVYHADVIEVG